MRGPRRVGATIASAAALCGSIEAQQTSRVSLDTSGVQGNADSLTTSISGDGRYVAFWSSASNLVVGDTNAARDVFVHDRLSKSTIRVSVDSSGAQANGESLAHSISADGRCVAFDSVATNLVLGDTNGQRDVFVHDRASGLTTRVSVDSSGAQANYGSREPVISGDGRYVAFESTASNLVPGDTYGYRDIFVHDRLTGATSRVSVSSSGSQASESSYYPSISADGRFVAFDSDSDDLVLADTNGNTDVFVHDRQSGSTDRVSVNSSGAQASYNSYSPSIPADGRYVAFESAASNLVTGDTNGTWDVFVHDLASGVTSRVSVRTSGAQGNGRSIAASISGDGRHVGFYSDATNLVAGDTNGVSDAFVRDVQGAATIRVSVDSSGAQANAATYPPVLDAGGCQVAFMSFASNLVAGDTNGATDAFVRDCDAVGSGYCAANPNSTGSPARISASGSPSAAAGDLVLHAALVPNQSGLYFHAAGQTQIVFCSGYLCATGGVVRSAVVQGAGNVSAYAYDDFDEAHSLGAHAGSTRHFQYWFRDVSVGGARFNTSDAISIAILP